MTFVLLGPACCTMHDGLQLGSFCYKWYYFILFQCWVVFNRDALQFLCPFIYWQTSGLFQCLYYSEWHCYTSRVFFKHQNKTRGIIVPDVKYYKEVILKRSLLMVEREICSQKDRIEITEVNCKPLQPNNFWQWTERQSLKKEHSNKWCWEN